MKKFLLLFFAGIFFTSCMYDVREDAKSASYVIETDSAFLVFSPNSRDYIELQKPVKLDTLTTVGIDLTIIKAAQARPGMTRIVDGKENNDYDVSKATGIWISVSSILAIAFLVIMVTSSIER